MGQHDVTDTPKHDDRATPGPWRVVSEEVEVWGGHKLTTHRIETAWDHPQMKGPLPVVCVGLSMKPDGKTPNHNIWMTRADAERIARVPELEREVAALRKLLEWYGEKAEAMHRYAAKQQTNGMMALVTELSMDAGQRARAALGSPQ